MNDRVIRLVGLPSGAVDAEAHEIRFVLATADGQELSFVAKYGVASQVIAGTEGIKLTDTSDISKLAVAWNTGSVRFDVPSANTATNRLLGSALIAAVIGILSFASGKDRSCDWKPGASPHYACAAQR